MASGSYGTMPGDELGLCPCGHRDAMCHRANAARWCPTTNDALLAELAEANRKLAETREALTWIANPSYVGNYAPLDVIGIHRKWATNALAPKVSGGDPVEVARPTSLAESQSGLNGPSGSPTSPPGRALELLRDFAKHGLRCDLNPTMQLTDVQQVYAAMSSYLRRQDERVRERARAALAVADEATTE